MGLGTCQGRSVYSERFEGVRFRARGRDVGEWTTDGLGRDCESFLLLEERVYHVQL